MLWRMVKSRKYHRVCSFPFLNPSPPSLPGTGSGMVAGTPPFRLCPHPPAFLVVAVERGLSLTRSATDPSFILSRYREKKRRRLEERRRLAGERQREMGSVRGRAEGRPGGRKRRGGWLGSRGRGAGVVRKGGRSPGCLHHHYHRRPGCFAEPLGQAPTALERPGRQQQQCCLWHSWTATCLKW